MKKLVISSLAALVIAGSAVSAEDVGKKDVCDAAGVCQVPDSTIEGPRLVSLDSVIPLTSDTTKPYFSDTSFTKDDEEKILKYLGGAIEIDDVKKSRREWMNEGSINMHYSLGYEGLGFVNTGLKFFKFWGSSEINIKIRVNDDNKSSFELNSKGPCFEIKKEDSPSGVLEEKLADKKNKLLFTDSTYVLESTSDSTLPKDTIVTRDPIDVIARISQMYTQFNVYKTFSSVEVPLVVDGKKRLIRVTIKNLNHNWYNFSYVDTRPAKTDKVQVHEVHALIYYPGDHAHIAVPYKVDIITTSGSADPIKLHAKLDM